MKINAVDLFCGIGGLTHGVEKSGINVLAGIDIDESCEFAYEKNNKAKFIHKSISDVTEQELLDLYPEEGYKVLMGCAPCQPFSSHNKNKQDRTQHKDWGLLYDFQRHVEKLKPEIVSMENVPALKREEIFKEFVESLKENGYFVSYEVVNAPDYGVPQRRKRLLLLASLLGEINFIPPTHENNHVTVRDAIGHLPKIKAGETNKVDYLHRSSSLNDINIERIKFSKPGGTWEDWPEEILPACYRKESGQTYTSVYGRMEWDEVSPTLTTQFIRYGTGRYGHPEQNRALSLREGAILQTFPDDYKLVESEKYNFTNISKQIGNAVPVILGEVIGESIKRHLEDMENEQ